ncbi:cox cluster protein [Halapricum sp. CBA1109]|uniref:DUF7520 family protein n=1 Tax=Halapricum sp. CBA1109 TaxID=2668068 RepID=UPI0012FAF91D|nr:cox cluster protein [Halapricum sp. CBA1109]MUV88882.1 cox cluster protein [Halapricum sp. CBA1109]
MSTQTSTVGWEGRRVVYAIYAGVVGIAALMGFVIGLIQPENLDPELFGVIQLPPTPVGMVVFGVVYVGLGVGILLLAVAVVADRFDDAAK